MNHPIDRKALDAVCRDNFHAFVKKSFSELNNGKPLERNWHIDAITHQVDQVRNGKCNRLIINLPPRMLKSHICSIALPAFILGKDPTRKIICVSYSQDLSEDLSNKFRRLVESDWYKRLFPNVEIKKNTNSEIATKQGGFRISTSPDGTLTGRGGDLIVVDDPISAGDANSESRRESVNSWFSTTLASRLDNPTLGAIIVVMQRLHENDLAGHLLQSQKWTVTSLPATTPTRRLIKLNDHSSHDWNEGEALDPGRLSKDILEEKRLEMGTAAFNAQYLQEPVSETGNDLNPQWIKYYNPSLLDPTKCETVQSWDTALKAGPKTDFSVCLTFKIENGNKYYLWDVYRARIDTPDLIREIGVQSRKYAAQTVLIEEMSAGIAVVQLAKQAGIQGIVPLKHRDDKRSRMKSASPKIEGGSLFLPNSSLWNDDFLKEFASFPAGHHDDQMDALSQFLNWRTNRESGEFECDFGLGDSEGAPDPEQIWHPRVRKW